MVAQKVLYDMSHDGASRCAEHGPSVCIYFVTI